jgi:hypothetical protein
VSSRHGDFNISRVDFLARGLRGLSTLGDSLSVGFFFACEARWIS